MIKTKHLPFGGRSPQISDSAVKKRKINRNGLVTLTNGVVSMRELALSTAVPTKGHDDDVHTLFDTKLSWGHLYALTFILCGKEHAVEKVRDLGTRLKITESCFQLRHILYLMLVCWRLSRQSQSRLSRDMPICMAWLRQLSRSCAMNSTAKPEVGNLFNKKVIKKNGVQVCTVQLHAKAFIAQLEGKI